jgi:putative addiction module CopG family antidote
MPNDETHSMLLNLTLRCDECTLHAMTVTLPSELQEFIEQSVKEGRFADERELLCEAIETLKTREEFRQFQLAGLKGKLRAGLADLDAGRVAEWNGEDIKRKGREMLAARLAGA